MNKSLWLSGINISDYPALDKDIITDVLIVGGGMAGITTAYLMQKSGYNTVLIEANRLMHGVSGNTTAKITAQHGLIYRKLIKESGLEQAEIYYKSNNAAIDIIQSIVKHNKIDCDFIRLPSYIFAEKESSQDNIERELDALKKIGANALYDKSQLLPIENKGAVKFENQAQFHPIKYLAALVKLYLSSGGTIYEGTRAKTIEDNHTVITTDGKKIRALHIVIASHYPFYDGMGMYFTRLYAERSYIHAVTIEEEFPNGMFINAENPTLSLRYHQNGNDKIILIGGQNHKTGENLPTSYRYNELLSRAKSMYTVKTNPYKWSAQDYSTPDGIPYIGRLTRRHDNVYITSGFGKWGMTGSTVAANLIHDLIEKKHNDYVKLYDPSRFAAKPASAMTFIKENLLVVKDLIKGKITMPEEGYNIEKGKGKIIESEGKKYGAYRDAEGKLYVMDITCPHLKCELRWNDAELTWDCPCHASRFNYDGQVIEGPAHNPLRQIDLKMEEE